jgi:hypothetical protein
MSMAVMAVALAAHAVSVNIVSVGSYTEDPMNPDHLTQDESVLFSSLGGFPVPGSTLHIDGMLNPYAFTATYSSANGDLVLDFVYDTTVVGGIGVSTDSGTWSYVSGTGAFAGMMGMGSYSINYNALANNYASTSIVGDIDAVPEPASMAALGVGAIAFMRRRKSAR